MQDLNDEVANARKVHVELVNQQGELAGEAKVSVIVARLQRQSAHVNRCKNGVSPTVRC
jgi:phosphoglycerate-specific signal transduction histidine kinase